MARKILLADDSVTAQNMGRRILTDAGYELVTVNNGSAALKKIAEFKPDIIILDVYMPGHSGLEVCQRIKETRETERIPVLLSVGKLEPFKPEEARRVRADAFIVKPFEASELLTALTKLEDKIVPQPEAYKPGRFAQAMARAEETAGFGDKESGWKDRIAIPSAKSKPAESEPEAPQPSVAAHRDAGTDDASQVNTGRVADFKPVDVALQFERPIPAGLPADITPEEIAAITSAAASFGGSFEANVEAKAEEKAEEKTEEKTAAQPPAAAVETATQPVADVPPVKAEAEVEEVPAATFASAAVDAPVNHAQPSTETVSAVAQAPVEAEAIKAAETASSDTPSAIEIAGQSVGLGAAAKAAITAPEAQSMDTGESLDKEKKRAVSDPEVLAALASLGIPTNGDALASDNVTASGLGLELGKTDAGPMSVAAVVANVEMAAASGPRWMAQEIPLQPDEASFILEQEMEKAYAAFAAADAARMSFPAAPPAIVISGAIESGAIESVPSGNTFSVFPSIPEEPAASATESAVIAPEPAEVKAEEPLTPVVAEGTSAEPVSAMTSSDIEAVASAPATEACAQSSEENVSSGPTLESAYAAAASAGTATEAIATPIPVPSTEAPESTSGGGERKETELAAAWANWRQIRQSIVGPQDMAETAEAPVVAEAAPEVQALAAEKVEAQTAETPTTEMRAEVKGEVEREQQEEAKQDEALSAHSDQEASPSAGEGDSPELSSIVDNMLAELKPRLMQELAKKMGNEKKKKKKRD